MIHKTDFSGRLIIKLMLLIIFSLSLAPEAQSVHGIYRVVKNGPDHFQVCIVDGALVRGKIYPEFVYGGNSQRYLFNPRNEIWIDNAISAEEYRYTLAHELNERHLMSAEGWTYAEAHDSSLKLERGMRLTDAQIALRHESELPKMIPMDCDGIKQISSLPDSIHLSRVYLQLYDSFDSISVWIVDGRVIRREIYPDFGFSGNDLVYRFIPPGEIWIDAQISCEETDFSIQSEKRERELMSKGADYDDAYETALKEVVRARSLMYKEAAAKPSIRVPKVKDRDKGTGKND